MADPHSLTPGAGTRGQIVVRGGLVLVLLGLFWASVYLIWIQPLLEERAHLGEAQTELQRELPTAQAQAELTRVEQERDALQERWESTSTTALGEQFARTSVTLLKAAPGEEPGLFSLELDGSAHSIGLILPELEDNKAGVSGPRGDGRLPPVLYFRRLKNTSPPPGRFLLEGVGRVSDLWVWRQTDRAAPEVRP